MKLTAKQKVFCEEYLKDLDATKAAIRAGYSSKTASEMGYENLRKPHLQEYIQDHKNKRSERTRITADKVLKELEAIALNDEEVKPEARIKALDLLGKHLGIYERDNSQKSEGLIIKVVTEEKDK